MEPMEQQQRLCPTCSRQIPVVNWDLHQARCTRPRGSNHNSTVNRNRHRRQWGDQCFWLLILCALLLLHQYIVPIAAWFYYLFFQSWRQQSPSSPSEFVSDEVLLAPYVNQGITGLVRAGLERKAYMSLTPPSYPTDPWPESYFDWNVVGKDDFWKALPWAWTYLKHPPDINNNGIFYLDFLPESVEHRAKAAEMRNKFVQFRHTVQTLEWTAEEPSRGVCQQQVDGTICAVYRWNAWRRRERDNSSDKTHNQEKGALLGRIQCWTDPSLTRSDPGFVQRHPQFHRYLHQSAGCMCLADLPGLFYIQIGAPEGVPALLVNDITLHIEATYDLEVEVTDVKDGPLPVVDRLGEYLFKFLDWFQDDENEDAGSNDDDDSSALLGDNDDDTSGPVESFSNDIEMGLPVDDEL